MKKRIIKLTESDLERLVKRIIKEDYDQEINREPISKKESLEKEEAWKKFQKEKHVTSKTVKVARKDFEKEWEEKNKKK
jgi:uncharacterized protein YifN (PemK superfamily)